jgi:hypothetical protein
MRSKKFWISKSRSETERIQAVNELLDEYRSQVEQSADKKINDPLLWQGIKDWGLRIFAKRDPVLALERLLGLRHARGKRAKNRATRRTAILIPRHLRL